MTNVKCTLVAMLGLAVIAGTISTHATRADEGKGKSREATHHQLMEGLVGPQCQSLGKELKADNVDWKKVALHAALLNECGHLLMADGRCPDADWKQGATTMQECSKVLLAKVKDKDVEGAQQAFQALTSGGCKTCHAKHKHD